MKSLRSWSLAAGLALVAALPGGAAPVQIDEVMAGAYGRPEIQFVELEIHCPGSSVWAGDARLTFTDAEDRWAGELVFPSEPGGSCAVPTSLLIATPAFASLPEATPPNFLMPPLLVPGSGKVCFEASWTGPICLSYGGFAGDSFQESPENAPPLPAEGVCSLRRVVFPESFGGTNRNADFDLAPPMPRNTAGVTRPVTVPPRFSDVPAGSPFRPFVEALFNAGVTGGCGGSSFCPQNLVTRDQMAVLLLRSREGTGFQPPACTVPVFADVPCSDPFAPWINELAARGITGGCGGGNYCPGAPVTRAAMAVFLLLAREGSAFQPPACVVPEFADVPCSDPFAPWINELAARGITGGCGGGNFCPGGAVTREQMAVFLSTAFDLPVPAAGCLDPMFADDHGDLPATATAATPTPAAPGTIVPGRLERPRDVDVFAFPAQAGEVFRLEADSGDPGDSFEDPGFRMALRVLGAAGQVLAESPLPDRFTRGTQARIVFTAPSAGPFFLEVRDVDHGQTGPYQVFLRGPMVDDHGGTPAQATPLAVDGAAVAGEFALPGDQDTFSFAATAGVIYEVEATAGTPGMTFHFSFRDAADQPVSAGSSDGQGTAYFFAPASGTFFVTLALGEFFIDPDATGPYTLRIRAIADDHGNIPATATPLQSGVAATGRIYDRDADVFHFTGQAGELVRITVRLLDFSHGVEAELFRLEGGSEEPLGELDLFQAGDLDVLVATLPESGSYFLRLSADSLFEQPIKDYSIFLEAPAVEDDHGDDPATATPVLVGGPGVGGQIEFPGEDQDVFAFAAVAGEPLEVRVDSGGFGLLILRADGTVAAGDGFDERLIFTADADGTYFAQVRSRFSDWGSYHITVRGLEDDHGDDAATATPLVPGAPPTAGEIDIPEDTDFFSFPAVAGQWLVIKLSPSDPFQQFTDLWILDTDGATRLFLFPRLTFPDLVFAFRAPVTGAYFLRVFADVGPYEVNVGPPVADDHGNTVAAATLTTVDAPPVSGTIEVWADSDIFSFDVTEGQTLVVETSGLTGGLDTIVWVSLPDGTFLGRDDDGGGGLASRFLFTATESGRYTASVSPFGFTSGGYLFSVSSSP